VIAALDAIADHNSAASSHLPMCTPIFMRMDFIISSAYQDDSQTEDLQEQTLLSPSFQPLRDWVEFRVDWQSRTQV